METTTELDEHIFLETYYQASGCSSKVTEHATRIKLLLNELNSQMSRVPQPTAQLKTLQKNYLSVMEKNDGTIPVDQILENKQYTHLADDLKVSPNDVIELNDFEPDQTWEALDRAIQNVNNQDNEEEPSILNFNLMADYKQEDEVVLLKQQVQQLQKENDALKHQIRDIKLAYEKAMLSRFPKTPLPEKHRSLHSSTTL
ncbi:Uncharacterized protein QTN25_002346 [Entamoeba marina]